jgi:hypothetical protein
VLIGALCLFGDIFVRRVALDYGYPWRWLARRLSGKQMSQQDAERQASLQRLRTRKSEVSEQVESAKASTRFEASEEVDPATLDQALGATSQAAPTKKTITASMTAKDEQDGYTSRLLAAKKAAKKKSDSDQN